MKKIISILLCVALILSSVAVVSFASEKEEKDVIAAPAQLGEETEAPASDADYPIIFVTGIGQSYSYFYSNPDDVAGYYEGLEKAKTDPSVIETDGATTRWNLFCNDFSFAFKEIGTYPPLLAVVGGLLLSVTGINCIPRKAVDKIVSTLFRYNTIDKEGKLPANVITPRCLYPVSQYTTEQRDNFYRSIPCKEVVGGIGEDMLYCFNYSAFSFTYDNADGLHTFINDYVLPQTGKDKVVLVPMSMGASVVSAYLQDYGTEGKVARVVSIVGCWDGSDVFADLIELKYAKDAPDKLYNGIIANLIGEPWGYLVNIVLRIFPKATLRSIIDEILDSIVENLIMKTPSLLALIPKDRYQAIKDSRLKDNNELGYILTMTDKYYECQCGLKDRLQMLNEDYGVEFYYLAGYDLGFGGLGSEGIYNTDYEFFRFFETADTTNSDEIIQISSTATGATYALRGNTLTAKGDEKYLSPDKAVDLSTCFFPDHVWLFQYQKHELENNNTALRLALDLACGKITGVDDPNSPYPRFNDSRDLKKLNRDYLPDLYAYVTSKILTGDSESLTKEQKATATAFLGEMDKHKDEMHTMMLDMGIYNGTEKGLTVHDYRDDFCAYVGKECVGEILTADQLSIYNDVIEMKESIFNNRKEDDAKIKALVNMMADLGIYAKSNDSGEKEDSFLKKANDKVYDIFGAKGFVDIFKK